MKSTTLAGLLHHTREAGARKPVWFSVALLLRARPKALSTKAASLRRGTHSRHPCRRGRGSLERYRRRGTLPCWPPARFDPHGRQDASPLNLQTTETSRHPSDFAESSPASEFEPCGPHPNTNEWTARWRPMRSSQPFPTIHGEVEGHDARSSSRAVSRSSIRSVVRLGPATGIRARKPRLLPHAREKLDDPRFQAKITSPSRLPPSRSRTRHAADPKVAARGRAGELKNHCLLRGTAWTR